MRTQRPFIEILDESIDRVLIGRESIDACIADHPTHEAELREELIAAVAFQQPFTFQPEPSRKRDSRLRFQEALDRKRIHRSWWKLPVLRAVVIAGPRFAAIAVVVCLALLGSGTGTVLASQGTEPGDLLYPVKTTSESVRLAFAVTDEREATLRTEFMDKRLNELEKVIASGDDRFLPGLVRKIVRLGARILELTFAPVRAVFDELPVVVEHDVLASSDGTLIATSLTPMPSDDSNEQKVSVRRALYLSERLTQAKLRVAEVTGKARTPAQREILMRLTQFLDEKSHELNVLLEQADAIHQPSPEVEAQEQRGRERDRQRDADRLTNAADSGFRRIEAELLDVSIHNFKGAARVEVRVRVADGSERVVHITRGGVKLLTGDGQGRLQDLLLHQTVVLLVDRSDGQVTEVHVERRNARRPQSRPGSTVPAG